MSACFCYYCGGRLVRKVAGVGYVFAERKVYEPGKNPSDFNEVRLHVTCARMYDADQKNDKITCRETPHV